MDQGHERKSAAFLDGRKRRHTPSHPAPLTPWPHSNQCPRGTGGGRACILVRFVDTFSDCVSDGNSSVK